MTHFFLFSYHIQALSLFIFPSCLLFFLWFFFSSFTDLFLFSSTVYSCFPSFSLIISISSLIHVFLSLLFCFVEFALKVLSGQIRSSWEWYRCKALVSFVNRYKFLSVDLECLKGDQSCFKRRSKLFAVTKNLFNPLILRRTACMKPWVPRCWRPFIRRKNLLKCCALCKQTYKPFGRLQIVLLT